MLTNQIAQLEVGNFHEHLPRGGHFLPKAMLIHVLFFSGHGTSQLHHLDERLLRVKPLRYPPANLIRGKLSFYWSSERHSELSPPRKECK